ncbi:probable nucleoporin Nup54 [Contarinia nasturtii]|uniref:probable nucleoporin Nup54 n=1 Tax=Contarinia nasturtii TaxID=265458 RepID=UPI0012D43DA6|nr:probable nucleoporin Nup54 [Contarinia nasturtii]
MSFNFGNTSAIGTSTPAKPAFGNLSFNTPATSAPPAFGTPAATQATGFGAAPSFGQSPFGGSSFGAPTTSAPAFGGFNTTTTSAATGLGGTTFTGFGQTAPATSAQTAFGAAFGSTLGGFGTSSAAPSFSFNTPSFGQPTTQTSTGFGGFGSTFGKPPLGGGFGTFGQTSTLPTLGQQQQLGQPQPPLNPDEAFAESIYNVNIFGDERDIVIAKWNYLQAMWGNGRAFYAKNLPPVEITPQNFLCRFKAIGYNKIPGKDNKMGLVSMIVKKSENDMRTQQEAFKAQLHQIFGNKPTITVNIDSIEPLLNDKCQVVIYVQEKSQVSNEIKRIASTEVNNFLNQPMTKSQLTNSGIDEVIALISPDEDQLKEYLDKPPKGIDPRMWNQAKQDNPDLKVFIPVPIIGFAELKRRIKCQEKETEMHSLYIAKVRRDLEEMKQKNIDAMAKISAHKRKLADLSHNILDIIVKQEITRKVGVALSPEEEKLRSKLENMQALVSAPTQYKGLLSELLSQMRMQRNQWNLANPVDYALEPDSVEEMKAFLSMQQKAMSCLIETVNKDKDTIKNIQEKLSELVN